MITVGAIDLEGTASVLRHDVPNWSAYGYTKDGFRKPEVAAAGRYMIGPVPGTSTLPMTKPQNVVSDGYMRLSGTSLAAPIVAGAAAQLLIEHPTWTPDQIKGALMQLARYVPDAPQGSAGVGEINAVLASLVTAPPNPNASLNNFLKRDLLLGTTEFDGAAWYAAARPAPPGTRLPGVTPPGATSPGRMSPGATSLGATCSQRQTSAGRTTQKARRAHPAGTTS